MLICHREGLGGKETGGGVLTGSSTENDSTAGAVVGVAEDSEEQMITGSDPEVDLRRSFVVVAGSSSSDGMITSTDVSVATRTCPSMVNDCASGTDVGVGSAAATAETTSSS